MDRGHIDILPVEPQAHCHWVPSSAQLLTMECGQQCWQEALHLAIIEGTSQCSNIERIHAAWLGRLASPQSLLLLAESRCSRPCKRQRLSATSSKTYDAECDLLMPLQSWTQVDILAGLPYDTCMHHCISDRVQLT